MLYVRRVIAGSAVRCITLRVYHDDGNWTTNGRVVKHVSNWGLVLYTEATKCVHLVISATSI
jgi:hypothetical protein